MQSAQEAGEATIHKLGAADLSLRAAVVVSQERDPTVKNLRHGDGRAASSAVSKYAVCK
jgi:hypothetical protein